MPFVAYELQKLGSIMMESALAPVFLRSACPSVPERLVVFGSFPWSATWNREKCAGSVLASKFEPGGEDYMGAATRHLVRKKSIAVRSESRNSPR